MAAVTQTQVAGTIQTLITSGALDGLTSTSLAAASPVTLTNAGYVFGLFELTIKFGTAPTANTTINIWFLNAIDGSNYEDGSSSVTPQRNPDLVFPLRNVNTTQRITKTARLPLSGTVTPLVLNNGSGQTTSTTPSPLNTLKVLALTNQFQ